MVEHGGRLMDIFLGILECHLMVRWVSGAQG